ncbi:MAG: tetraacyldisaccharide 4'-kinase [Phycisphaera sp.]|nr:tetraacyldisaccharide 4'-kinase [Phycisphaera sp.]
MPRMTPILGGEDRSALAGVVRTGLLLGEPFYRAAVATRNTLYDRGLAATHALGRPTVSVGNLSVGGTGKTPMVVELSRRLLSMGHHPAILMRGYKRSAGISDEEQVYRQALGQTVPVAANPDRVARANQLLVGHPGVSVFLLDDGFQHRRVQRDIDLVLVDARNPFTLGHTLPRGLLREPASSLRRATAVIVTHADHAQDLAALDDEITRYHGKKPIAHTRHAWQGFLWGDERIASLEGMKVTAVVGVGNPSAFEKTLRSRVGVDVLAVRIEDDHAAYTRKRLEELFAHARDRGADAVVTTEKDHVKWLAVWGDSPMPLRVVRPVLAIEFIDGSDALDALLRRNLS